jgi:hypothetical protein
MKLWFTILVGFVMGLAATAMSVAASGEQAMREWPNASPLARGASPLAGECASSPTPSCGVYEGCFMKYCNCAGNPDEYFETYGLKYCRAFLANANFSEQGQKWRDATLVCLQEAIVPKLDISPTPKCDCKAMRAFAYASHVACYTQAGKSICELPMSDVHQIYKTISIPDMLSGDGRRQMREVAGICAKSAPADGRRGVWKALALFIGA